MADQADIEKMEALAIDESSESDASDNEEVVAETAEPEEPDASESDEDSEAGEDDAYSEHDTDSDTEDKPKGAKDEYDHSDDDVEDEPDDEMNEEVNVNGKRRYRWRPGTVAIREIKRYQQSVDLLIPKMAFRRLCKEIVQDLDTNGIRLSPDATDAIQEDGEAMLVSVFAEAQTLAIHAGREIVTPVDIALAADKVLKGGYKGCSGV